MLFGGKKTKTQFHNSMFELKVSTLDDSYSFSKSFYVESKICGSAPKLTDHNLINQLKKKGIILADLRNSDCEINLFWVQMFVDESVPIDPDLTPITPTMFLCNNKSSETTDLDVLDGNRLRKRLRFRAKMIQVLREQFRKEYLGQLVQRHRQHPQSSNIHTGDIVLIDDDVKKRQWPLARVIELISGKDGHVRTVRVKTQHSTLVRPLQRIFPLKESGSDFQKQLGSSDDSSMETFVNDVNLLQVSRFGREIKRPNRLNFSDS
ncbi:hypothetical protein HNY73_005423 [Argiope bruennichi]|uniref:DUF5641 domain-containing protein n=1 Tax=Argiope bruennichi TaxID=94029 RepID=A0A8T0FLF8_ARGBR|nr:hypothetical protein HNY73_005423 [Argiope bruennichi]